EVDFGGGARELRVGAVLEQALDDLQRVVAPAEAHEDVGRGAELLDGGVDVLDPHERLSKAEVRERVLRVELDDLAEDVDRVAIAVRALVPRRHLVVGGERVAHEAELNVSFGELRDDVAEAVLEVRDVLVNDLADLLEDRDRFRVKALRRVELPDALVD